MQVVEIETRRQVGEELEAFERSLKAGEWETGRQLETERPAGVDRKADEW